MAEFDPTGATVSPGQFDPTGAVPTGSLPQRGMVSKLASAVGHGIGEELTGTFGKTLGLAASAPFVAADALGNMITGGQSTGVQDWAFKNLVDPTVRAAAKYAPTAEEAASVPLSVAHGLGALAVDLPLIAGTGGKLGAVEGAGVVERALHGITAMAPVATAHAVSQAETAVGQGVDLPTAYTSGAVAGMTTAAMGAVPLALAGGLAKRALTGAVSGVASGELGREAQNAALSDYPELQAQLSPQGIAVNAVTGAMLGAVLGPRPFKTQVNNALKDAQEDVNAGAPVEKPATPLQDQQRAGFMDSVTNAKDDALRPGEMTPIDQFFAGKDIDKRVTETTPPKLDAEESIGGADLQAELGVHNALDVVGAEAKAEAAARARIEQTELPADLPTIEPVIARSQAHAEDMAILRDAGETPTGDPKLDAAAAFALHNDVSPDLHAQLAENFAAKIDAAQDAPGKVRTPIDDYLASQVAAEPVSDRTNTQVADALADAQRSRVVERAQGETEAAFAERAAAENAAKERDLTAIQNITKGGELADAAERGAVPDNARLLPAPNNEFLANLKEVTPEDQKLPPKIKQELAQAVKGKDSYDAQLEAIGALRDGKKEGSVSFELLDKMYNKLTEGRELQNVKAQEAAPVETVEAKAQGPEVPAAGASPDATKPAEVSQRDLSQSAADRLDATVMAFNERVRAGEKFTPEEQARYDEASELRKVLSRALDTNNKGASDAYLKDLAEFADNTATPEAYAAQGPRLAREATAEKIHIDDYNPGVAEVARTSNRAADMLGYLKENGSEQWVKDLAARLVDLKLHTTLEVVDDLASSPKAVGEYHAAKDKVLISSGKYGLSEHTVLHEVMHAATYDALDLASQIGKPRSQLEAQQKAAYDGLEKVRAEALKRASANEHYGLTSVHEFVAELNTNPEFQDFLRQPANKSMWTKAVDFIAKLLGIPRDGRDGLEKALSFQDAFFGRKQYEQAQVARMQERIFNDSTAGAARVTDESLSRIVAGADDQGRKPVDFRSIDRGVFQKLLGWETVQYIADRARALPEMVQSGFSKGMDAYVSAYQTRNLANHYAEGTAASFASDVQRKLGKMDAPAARELNQRMSEIAVGSSIGGFDPTMNFDANLKARPDLSTSNKAYIDGIYRQFKALERSDPAAAKAIVEGAQVNRKGYVLDVATVIKNLMQHAIDTSTTDAGLAAQHVAGLDFMAKDVQTAKNNNTKQHIDGASYMLDQRIKAAFTAAKALPEGSLLRTQLGELQGKYTNAIDNPYYHAGRSGNYFTKIGFKDMDAATWEKMQQALAGTNKVLGDFTNQSHAFFRVDSADQAVGLMNKLVEAGGAKIVMGESARGKLSEGGLISNNAGISAALRSVLGTMHDAVDAGGLNGDQAALMKEAMTRKFLSLLPESSTRLATIKRMGVPGYDGDFLGSFAKRAAGGITDTANIYALPGYTNAFKGMSEAVQGMTRGGDVDMQARAQMMHDEIAKRYSGSMQPMDSSHVNLINSLGHSFYLALSPAFFLRSMAQPLHRGVPYLGSKFGFVNSAKEIGAATGTAMKIMGATIKQGWDDAGARGVLDAGMKFTDMGLTPKEEAFVQEMHDRGALNLGQARQLQRMAMGGSQLKQDLVRFTSMTAQYADMTNRLATGLAAFRLAEKKGGQTSANTDYAIKAVDLTMDNFDQNNTARQIGKQGFAGKVTPLMTAFMNYNLQTMQQIARTVHEGMFNRDTSPEGLQRSKEAKREFAGLMGTTAMISGAMGLPFVTAFAGVYNMLTKDDDKPSDIRLDARNALSDMFGQKGGNLIANGLPSAIGVDSSTFGLQSLLPGSDFLASRRLMKDRLADLSQGLMGPALNAGMDMGLALSKFSDGQYVKGIEQALPSGLKAFWKAGEIAANGFTDARGNKLGLDADGWDVAVQATGLRPAKRAVQAEASNFFHTNEELRNHRKQVIVDSIYKAVTSGDADAKADALADMREFNAKNPTQPIRDIGSTFRRHAIEQAVARASMTGVGAPAKRIGALRDELRFSNTAMPEN